MAVEFAHSVGVAVWQRGCGVCVATLGNLVATLSVRVLLRRTDVTRLHDERAAHGHLVRARVNPVGVIDRVPCNAGAQLAGGLVSMM